MPVDWTTYQKQMRDLVKFGLHAYPDTTHVVYLGFGTGRGGFQIESVADNLRGQIADNAGHMPGIDVSFLNQQIGRGLVLRNNLTPLHSRRLSDLDPILRAIQTNGIRIKMSNDAGDFCVKRCCMRLRDFEVSVHFNRVLLYMSIHLRLHEQMRIELQTR